MAAVDFFLKIEGIDGESSDSSHKGEIEIASFSWGVSNSAHATGGGGGAGKVAFQDIHFTTRASKASPQLMLACAGGTTKGAMLTCRKAGKGQLEFLKIKLTDVLISSYSICGNEGETPMDEFSLSFSKIDFSYTPVAADGSVDQPVVGSLTNPDSVGRAGMTLRKSTPL